MFPRRSFRAIRLLEMDNKRRDFYADKKGKNLTEVGDKRPILSSIFIQICMERVTRTISIPVPTLVSSHVSSSGADQTKNRVSPCPVIGSPFTRSSRSDTSMNNPSSPLLAVQRSTFTDHESRIKIYIYFADFPDRKTFYLNLFYYTNMIGRCEITRTG